VNAQVYMRGRPSDYDEWQDTIGSNNAKEKWGWEQVLPHFRRMESNNRLNNDFHSTDGPMLVSDPGHIDTMSRWFVQAVQGLGEPFNPDFNGVSQRGVGFYQFMNRHGKRSSAAYAYISPQANNPNLTVELHAEVLRIIIENGRAVGVEYKDKAGATQTVHSTNDIILTAGALMTPKLLMQSGIGPADHLKEHGIDVAADLPGVGQNLIDHPEVPITALANGPYGYYKQGVGWRMLKNGLQFKLFGSGPITSAGVEAGAFVNPNDREAPPSIQAFCVPIVYLDRDTQSLLNDGYGLTVTTVVIKPKSRGEVRLRSANPLDMPLVSPNLLKHPDDMKEMIAGQRFFVEAFQTSPLSKHIERIAIPAPDELSDEALAAHCKRFVKTNYHPSGTARMGSDNDPMAVLDAQMRVRGVDNLRVCDMSAVPNINAGNTNAPAMMLGDRCAEFLMA
ncbi:MAG: GMC family oxidoreductase, partial [Thiolinea sp.]